MYHALEIEELIDNVCVSCDSPTLFALSLTCRLISGRAVRSLWTTMDVKNVDHVWSGFGLDRDFGLLSRLIPRRHDRWERFRQHANLVKRLDFESFSDASSADRLFGSVGGSPIFPHLLTLRAKVDTKRELYSVRHFFSPSLFDIEIVSLGYAGWRLSDRTLLPSFDVHPEFISRLIQASSGLRHFHCDFSALFARVYDSRFIRDVPMAVLTTAHDLEEMEGAIGDLDEPLLAAVSDLPLLKHWRVRAESDFQLWNLMNPDVPAVVRQYSTLRSLDVSATIHCVTQLLNTVSAQLEDMTISVCTPTAFLQTQFSVDTLDNLMYAVTRYQKTLRYLVLCLDEPRPANAVNAALQWSPFSILSSCSHITWIFLAYNTRTLVFHDEEWDLLARSWTYLRLFDISGVTMRCEHLQSLITHCQHLEKIVIGTLSVLSPCSPGRRPVHPSQAQLVLSIRELQVTNSKVFARYLFKHWRRIHFDPLPVYDNEKSLGCTLVLQELERLRQHAALRRSRPAAVGRSTPVRRKAGTQV